MGLVLALAAFTCPAQELPIAVSRTSSAALPFYVAAAQQHFAAEGVAVKTLECIGGQRCMKLLLEGQVALATATEMAVMLNSFARSDYAIVPPS